MFQYLATAGQTEFTGADTNGNNLSFSNIEVFKMEVSCYHQRTLQVVVIQSL